MKVRMNPVTPDVLRDAVFFVAAYPRIFVLRDEKDITPEVIAGIAKTAYANKGVIRKHPVNACLIQKANQRSQIRLARDIV